VAHFGQSLGPLDRKLATIVWSSDGRSKVE